MKRIIITLATVACVFSAQATTVLFENGGSGLTTTGDSLDGIGTNFTAVSVLEIPGLNLSIATATDGHTLNANSGDFGVDSDLAGEVNDRFDFGEAVLMSFDDDIEITKIDFSDFDSGETFNFIIGTITNSIAWSDLTDQSSDYIDGLSWNVTAGTLIRMEVAGSGDSLSMDAIDIVPEPATMAMFGIGGLIAFVIRRSALK